MGLLKPAIELAVRFLAVIVIGIDDDERLGEQLPGSQHGLTGAPGLFPVCGHLEAGGNVPHILERIMNLYIQTATQRLNPVTNPAAEVRLNILADDKNQLVESGCNGIVDGVVHDDFIIQAHRLQLLDAAAEPRANPGCHNQQCCFHVSMLLRL